jgi:hypothetical protein
LCQIPDHQVTYQHLAFHFKAWYRKGTKAIHLLTAGLSLGNEQTDLQDMTSSMLLSLSSKLKRFSKIPTSHTLHISSSTSHPR